VPLDALAPVPTTKRELLVWIWYPAAAGQPDPRADNYAPASARATARPASGPLTFRILSWIFELLTRDLSKVHGHSLPSVDVSLQQRSYPVVIMRAGGSLEVWHYLTLAENWPDQQVRARRSAKTV